MGRHGTIAGRKAAQDSKRAALFTKYARAITVAAKAGGDPEYNATLRLAIEKAKAISMPNDNINRAIKKGTGELAGETYEELSFEGYGVGGVAVIVEALTDNTNRTTSSVRSTFDKYGGNLGTPGCVSYMFSRKGIILVEKTDEVDEDALMELADSIRQFGILQPLLVQKKKNYYEIIAGERRWRAAKLAGIKEVPIIVKDYTDQEIVEISLIENIQRENLNPIEEAMAFKRLLQEFQLKQDEVAERVSKSRTAVTNSMRLLKLSPRVQQMIIDDMISTGHARALLAIDDEEQQFILANKIFDEKLSVRETEKLVKALKNPKKEVKKEKSEHTFIYENIEEQIKNIMGTKVSVNQKANGKGKIEIEYYSEEELERIYDLLMTIPRGE